MSTSQKRYEQTEKGKLARLRATQNYQSKKEMWKGYFSPEVTTELEARFPGMSRSAILNHLAQEYLGRD